MRFKQTIYESTRAPLARSPLPHAGKAQEERRFASIFIKGDARK